MFTIVIQAGGQSSRMGRDKALLPFCGRPLIERVVDRLADLEAELLVTTNHPEDYSFLGLPMVGDILPGMGALGGLFTALSAAQHSLVAVVGCDMPFVNAELLAAERDLLIEGGVDVVIPVSESGLEPLHAVYSREDCMPALKSALDDGRRRMVSWLPDVRVCEMGPDVVARFDPQFNAFLNVNTPQEFAAAEEIACGK